MPNRWLLAATLLTVELHATNMALPEGVVSCSCRAPTTNGAINRSCPVQIYAPATHVQGEAEVQDLGMPAVIIKPTATDES